jgi:hypothetical protein
VYSVRIDGKGHIHTIVDEKHRPQFPAHSAQQAGGFKQVARVQSLFSVLDDSGSAPDRCGNHISKRKFTSQL